jgi:hypothetical protein
LETWESPRSLEMLAPMLALLVPALVLDVSHVGPSMAATSVATRARILACAPAETPEPAPTTPEPAPTPKEEPVVCGYAGEHAAQSTCAEVPTLMLPHVPKLRLCRRQGDGRPCGNRPFLMVADQGLPSMPRLREAWSQVQPLWPVAGRDRLQAKSRRRLLRRRLDVYLRRRTVDTWRPIGQQLAQEVAPRAPCTVSERQGCHADLLPSHTAGACRQVRSGPTTWT